MTDTIDSFKGEYFFLSNYYRQGPRGISVESMFQSKKTPNDRKRREIMRMSPAAAKRAGNNVKLRADWQETKVHRMAWLVYIKFSTYPRLREKLLDTGKAMLVEGNTWHDNFWGDCRCGRCADVPGANTLGVILMSVRVALQLGPTRDD
jgi:ribA/ribD-fused uncharacterized protein